MDIFHLLTQNPLQRRREIVFLLLTGLFLSTFALLNVLGLTRIINFDIQLFGFHIPAIIPLGVLPYPITFICADLITEFYGKERARMVVWMGLIINLWIAFILWASAYLPPAITLDPLTHMPKTTDPSYSYYLIRQYTISGIFGSMIAYLIAQLLDVHIFAWCKNITKGKHLWFRSNVSTLISQLVDTVIVTTFSFYFTDAVIDALNQHDKSPSVLFTVIMSGYFFKTIATILSTIPFCLTVYFLRGFLEHKPLHNTPPLKILTNPT